jgi:hypothetical protein
MIPRTKSEHKVTEKPVLHSSASALGAVVLRQFHSVTALRIITGSACISPRTVCVKIDTDPKQHQAMEQEMIVHLNTRNVLSLYQTQGKESSWRHIHAFSVVSHYVSTITALSCLFAAPWCIIQLTHFCAAHCSRHRKGRWRTKKY